MQKNIKRKKNINCVLCGATSPNVYGECLCSYEAILITNDYEKISKLLARQCTQLFRAFIKK